MKSRELRNIAFIFVNDYFFIEETGELIGIRADFLNEFRLIPLDFDIDEIKYGTYILFAGKKVLRDEIRRNEISEEEEFSSGEKRMIWLSYGLVNWYEKRIWMRLRVTKISKCEENVYSMKTQRMLCYTTRDNIDRIIRMSKPRRVYLLPNLKTGLIPLLFLAELKRYIDLSKAEKLYLGIARRYKSIVIYPYRTTT